MQTKDKIIGIGLLILLVVALVAKFTGPPIDNNTNNYNIDENEYDGSYNNNLVGTWETSNKSYHFYLAINKTMEYEQVVRYDGKITVILNNGSKYHGSYVYNLKNMTLTTKFYYEHTKHEINGDITWGSGNKYFYIKPFGNETVYEYHKEA